MKRGTMLRLESFLESETENILEGAELVLGWVVSMYLQHEAGCEEEGCEVGKILKDMIQTSARIVNLSTQGDLTMAPDSASVH